MSEQGFYHPARGYWQTNAEASAEVLAAYPEGTKQVPVMPGPGYVYDGNAWQPPSQQWIDEQAEAVVRSERAYRLAREVDVVARNPLRWGSLSAEKQAEWAAYRTALLEITNQPGFPHQVLWPTKPS